MKEWSVSGTWNIATRSGAKGNALWCASLYIRIKELREKYSYTPSDEIIIDICINEIMQGQYKKVDPRSIMNDYVDEFIRKMRMSGLISLRGAGRFIDINHNEDNKVEYILNNYSDYERFTDEHK